MLASAGFRGANGAQDPHQRGAPHQVHVFHHMYGMCMPPSHFY